MYGGEDEHSGSRLEWGHCGIVNVYIQLGDGIMGSGCDVLLLGYVMCLVAW